MRGDRVVVAVQKRRGRAVAEYRPLVGLVMVRPRKAAYFRRQIFHILLLVIRLYRQASAPPAGRILIIIKIRYFQVWKFCRKCGNINTLDEEKLIFEDENPQPTFKSRLWIFVI